MESQTFAFRFRIFFACPLIRRTGNLLESSDALEKTSHKPASRVIGSGSSFVASANGGSDLDPPINPLIPGTALAPLAISRSGCAALATWVGFGPTLELNASYP